MSVDVISHFISFRNTTTFLSFVCILVLIELLSQLACAFISIFTFLYFDHIILILNYVLFFLYITLVISHFISFRNTTTFLSSVCIYVLIELLSLLVCTFISIFTFLYF